jgi:hypothetical protein
MMWSWSTWSTLRRLVVVAAAVIAALAVVVALLWPFTDVIAAHDVGLVTGSARAAHLQTAREAVRTQLLTLGAGIFAAGALIFTARNFTLSRRTVELQRQTFALTQEGQVTDRYTKAVEQLGSDKIDVRIGGIYALERIARDSARDHPTVMEVLAAFVREHSDEPAELPEPVSKIREPTLRSDVQAAITVIARRDATRDRGSIDLMNADLTNAYLYNADLAGVEFYGADLIRANLINADLAGAKLLGADLTAALLYSADLVGANLADADLTDADLEAADLTRADLTNATWPENVPAPDGWIRGPDSDRLLRAVRKAEDAGN